MKNPNKIISKFFILLFFLSLLLIRCKKDETENNNSIPSLILISSYSLQVSEPSGLSLAFSENELYTVSDYTDSIYKISLTGEILKTLSYKGSNIEGITVNPADSTIWIIEENSGEVVKTDINGNEIERFLVYVSQIVNKGLEGITYNPVNSHFYLVSEQSPSWLIEWSPVTGIIDKYNLTFADDYSGIFYDNSDDVLWIVSDESQSLNKCTLTGKLLQTYTFLVKKAEGVVVDTNSNKIYIVCDEEGKLFVFNYSS